MPSDLRYKQISPDDIGKKKTAYKDLNLEYKPPSKYGSWARTQVENGVQNDDALRFYGGLEEELLVDGTTVYDELTILQRVEGE